MARVKVLLGNCLERLRTLPAESVLRGWKQGCACPEHVPVPCVVLDPFAGSGTTGATAVWRGRNAILIELNADYLPLIRERVGRALRNPGVSDPVGQCMSVPA